MTSRSSFEPGWNKTKTPGLQVYVAKDGVATGYYKGRVNGKVESVKLDGETITDWKESLRALRGDDEEAERLVSGRRTTVGRYALDTFAVEQRKLVGHSNPRQRRSRRAVEDDIRRIERFIAPSKLGRMKFGDVRLKHVRSFVKGLDALRQANGKPYAQATQRDIVRILGAIFREAVKDEVITRSPVRELAPDERPSGEPQRSQRYLDVTQVSALLARISPTFQVVLTLCAWAGLRVSEALGLVWSDVDLDAGELTISAQLDGVTRVPTKTRRSAATIQLLPIVVEALKAHRREQAAKGIHLVAGDAFVFTTATGRPQSRRNVLRALQTQADALGLNPEGMKPVGIHSLRHSFVSLAVAEGLTVPEAALLARDSERTITTHYVRVQETQRKEAISKLQRALGA
jgi:integrase